MPTCRSTEASTLGYLAGGEDYFTKVAEGGTCKSATFSPLDFWEDHAPATNPKYLGWYSAYIYGERAVSLIEQHAAAATNTTNTPATTDHGDAGADADANAANPFCEELDTILWTTLPSKIP